MLVRAVVANNLENSRRRVGDTFEYSGALPLPACIVAVTDQIVEAPKAVQAPIALSELANQESKPVSFVESVNKRKK